MSDNPVVPIKEVREIIGLNGVQYRAISASTGMEKNVRVHGWDIILFLRTESEF